MSALDFLRYFPERKVRTVKWVIAAVSILILGMSFCAGALADRLWHL